MANILFLLTILTTCLTLIQSLQLNSLSTKKPRTTKQTPKPATATKLPAISSVYRVNATNGATCILIRTDGLLSIQYKDKLNDEQELDVYLPDEPELSGDCSESDTESVTMIFSGFTLSMYFRKTPGGERWYVSSIDVQYSTSNTLFKHIDIPDLEVKLSTPLKSTLLFPTPIGKSYSCDQEINITMYSPNERDRSGHLAKLYLRDLRMQGFMFKAANKWGPSYQCSATGTYRDESAPFAVGLTLALSVVAIIAAYAAWSVFSTAEHESAIQKVRSGF